MALFRRRKKPNEAPNTPAVTLGANICLAALGWTRSLIKEEGVPLESSEAWRLYSEYVFLLVHIADRAAFSLVPQPTRAAFIDEFMPLTPQLMILAWGEVAPSRSPELPSLKDLHDEMYTRHLEYGCCLEVVSSSISPDNQSDTVLGSFFRHLPEPWRTDFLQNPYALFQAKLSLNLAIGNIDLENQLALFSQR